jgi:pyrroline-5-carboxylate reductase
MSLNSKSEQAKTADGRELRVAMLGTGKMGGILLQGFLQAGLLEPDQIAATVAHEGRAREIHEALGVQVGTDNRAAVRGADVVLLGVKPHQIAELVAEIRTELHAGALLISFAASVKTRAIEDAAGGTFAVVRAMPNTPSAVGAGMTALCRGRFVSDAQLEIARKVFGTVGLSVVVDEKHMDAVTGVSGSGPAFLYVIIEALAEAGVNVGLPRDTATLLAAQTTFGAAKMVLETGSHPALLKDEVTTPGGCTVDGLLELEAGGLRITLLKAVKRTAERARELAGG